MVVPRLADQDPHHGIDTAERHHRTRVHSREKKIDEVDPTEHAVETGEVTDNESEEGNRPDRGKETDTGAEEIGIERGRKSRILQVAHDGEKRSHDDVSADHETEIDSLSAMKTGGRDGKTETNLDDDQETLYGET
jgi:hypothetical protein